MSAVMAKAGVRERILEVAGDLFFCQGYRATGINEIISKADVAKASFYHHFPSKEALCVAFLEQHNDADMVELRAFVDSRRTPRTRYLAVIECLGPYLQEGNFRGCVFLNMISDFPDPVSPARRVGVAHYQRIRDLVAEVTRELISSDPGRYATLDADRVADEYMVIFTGLLSQGALTHSNESLRPAIRAVERMIE